MKTRNCALLTNVVINRVPCAHDTHGLPTEIRMFASVQTKIATKDKIKYNY